MGMMRDLAEMVDSIMDRAWVGPEMAARADMVKAARGEEDRVDPVAEREIPAQNPGKQTPAAPAPTTQAPERNLLRNPLRILLRIPPVAPVVQAAQVPER